MESYSRSGGRIERVSFGKRSCSVADVPNRLDEAICELGLEISSLCLLRTRSLVVSIKMNGPMNTGGLIETRKNKGRTRPCV